VGLELGKLSPIPTKLLVLGIGHHGIAVLLCGSYRGKPGLLVLPVVNRGEEVRVGGGERRPPGQKHASYMKRRRQALAPAQHHDACSPGETSLKSCSASQGITCTSVVQCHHLTRKFASL